MTNPTTNTALSRLRTLMAEQPFSGAAGRVQDRLARAIVSEEAVRNLARIVDPEAFELGFRGSLQKPFDKARSILEALAADAIGDER